MRRSQTKKTIFSRPGRVLVLLAILLAAISPVVYATKPYFKAFGADVFTGGWFNDGVDACTTSTDYQDPIATPDQRGGIITYSKTTPLPAGQPAGGSSSQYGAISVGLIDGIYGDITGFYSSGATAASDPADRLALANNGNDFGGDLEAGPPRQGNCIPDYFNTKRALTSPSSLPDISLAPSGEYYYVAPDNTPITFNGGNQANIAPGQVKSVFVQGNVYIRANIVNSGSPTVTNVPKFALVVLGNIYMDPAVRQLDGLFIAQPLPKCDPPSGPTPCTNNPVNDDTGNIWTCHDSSVIPPASPFLNGCNSKLTVNGALIAKQVKFMRTGGDVATATTNEDNLSNAIASNNIAELIYYTPAMVIGGPYFFSDTGLSPTLQIQSLVSLPPVF
ncbi:hypothetical protein A3E49_03220 [Candidatus Saccharibacteria bacterium RIFCSPHIGHO2_12_FULL_49_19]|nr:MAG: hypothetical protein A2708_01520 [Candidatus Saccharibacteria bacterium RIFCSPHIGHO2_01_FULL_49_21]OGL36927.1 MAG: hypothetical protein A3E49_03220 [Candidatus Saccharibacteria bacterium RIFCSPHIGHO2_12_FULL_49_19]OGL37741.1 MAG: hypothetical protein A3B63_00100 [Candidatus Saccharibacteria bacterium RIFCSPLOWO2_01_FULL_49_22]